MVAVMVAVGVVAVVEITAFAVVVVVAIVVVDVHTVDPEEPVNMLPFVAFEFTQEIPQSI